MAEPTRTITVTEEEYQMLLRVREQLRRKGQTPEGPLGASGDAPGKRAPSATPLTMDSLKGRGPDFALGAVAGMAAYWLYEELLEDDDEDEEVEDRPRRERRVHAAPKAGRRKR